MNTECITLLVTENGNLKISLTKEGREELKELMEKEMHPLEIWGELMESIEANSEYSMLAPESIGALTEAPIIGNGYYIDNTGKVNCHEDAKVWYYNEYMLLDEFQELMDKGEIILMAA